MNTKKGKQLCGFQKRVQFLFHLVIKLHLGTLFFALPLFTPPQHRHPAGHAFSLSSQNVAANELWQ